MFERYSEKARRVIFFARYEASNYGSPYIETEHLLLGILREDRGLSNQFLEDAKQIREEIEARITRGTRFSTSVEVPLSQESTMVLRLAAEEARRLGNNYVEPGHILIGIMRVEDSLAARMLLDRGIKLELVREWVVKPSGSGSAGVSLQASEEAVASLYGFLATLESNNWVKSALYFAKNAQFIDSTGKRWRGRQEIEKQFEMLFVPYAKKNVTFRLESADIGPANCLVTNVLWENVIITGESAKSIHRMTVILSKEVEDWVIFLVQVTPISPDRFDLKIS